LIGKIPKLSMKLIVKLGSLSINDDTLKDTVERDNALTRKRILVDYFHFKGLVTSRGARLDDDVVAPRPRANPCRNRG
jgi:hypothetical protein